ncbi:hypothetical protein DFA_05859 [Cavenderia fasciculata]|uniref:DUSP domain-containing protein n=1 Tax=Cavenderia fasciculata TaxID=261658 RepID=F4PN35_CACFS|nr:uncharacterized protein DFA_05859 [Cavenderia fasciculata]EGG23725.1 hypothetical protein DFA_05859 [Cavenderia fasciculata]|eukprot:XP_004361576.1 hypothetical protein DFA_05859 [Cavenderia fasciculata]
MLFNFWSLIPSTFKALTNFRRINDLYKHVQEQQKNVILYHLGHWVKLKVGGQPFIVRRRTLTWYPGSVFSSIAQYDKKTSMILSDLFKGQPFSMAPSGKPHVEQNIAVATQKTDEESSLDTKVESDQVVIQQHHQRNLNKNTMSDHASPYFKLEKDTDGYYMIDRDSALFGVVLNFLRTGELPDPLPSTIDARLLLLEAQFYHLKELQDRIKEIMMRKKRQDEKAIILNQEIAIATGHKQQIWFVVEKKWIDAWRQFIENQDELNHPPPSAVNNLSLYTVKGENQEPVLKDNLVYGVDYVCVTKEVWFLIEREYPMSGPMMLRTSPQIYSSPMYQSPFLFSFYLCTFIAYWFQIYVSDDGTIDSIRYIKYDGVKDCNNGDCETSSFSSSAKKASRNTIAVMTASLAFTVLAWIFTSVVCLFVMLSLVGILAKIPLPLGKVAKFLPILVTIFGLLAVLIFTGFGDASYRDCKREEDKYSSYYSNSTDSQCEQDKDDGYYSFILYKDLGNDQTFVRSPSTAWGCVTAATGLIIVGTILNFVAGKYDALTPN